MSTEWNEDNIKSHMFTEVEVSDNERAWSRGKLYGFTSRTRSRFLAVGATWLHMRLIPKPKRRLMKPIELAGKWLDFGDEGMSLMCGFGDDSIETSHDSFEVEAMNCHNHGCQGWRDTPTSELNTSFEVDE
jgi:hypothetical protein